MNDKETVVHMSPERKQLQTALNAATLNAQTSVVDMSAVRETLSNLQKKARANIDTLDDDQRAIDDDYAAFSHAVAERRREQESIIAMTQAALDAAPKTPSPKVVSGDRPRPALHDDETRNDDKSAKN